MNSVAYRRTLPGFFFCRARARLRLILSSAIGLTISLVMMANAEPIPQSLLLFEQMKERMPVHTVDGVPLQGLDLCRVTARACDGDYFPLFPLDFTPADVPCDLTHVILAFNGACEAGVIHETNPHLAPSMFPWARCQLFGIQTVVWLTHGHKVKTVLTVAGEAQAVAWLTHVAAGLQVEPWSPGVPLLPDVWREHLPPHPVGR